MKIRSLLAAGSIGSIFLLVHGINAEAAELKVLSAFGMQSVLEDLGPKFEHATGHKLAISFATGGATVKRVQGGDAADVVITLQPGINSLVKDGKAVPVEEEQQGLDPSAHCLDPVGRQHNLLRHLARPSGIEPALACEEVSRLEDGWGVSP